MIHGVTPARVSTSATKRASFCFVFSVVNTATTGFGAVKKPSRSG
jgi:hypothetical protein